MNDEVMLRYDTIRSYEVRTVAIGQIFFFKDTRARYEIVCRFVRKCMRVSFISCKIACAACVCVCDLVWDHAALNCTIHL